MEFITGYESPKEREKRSTLFGTVPVGDSLTVQADARDADINVIVDRYVRTGHIPALSRVPSYGDFDGISDYRTALHAVRAAEEQFMALPAKVRSRFENDPAAFVDFCEDPANRVELADLGLLSKEAADAVRKEAAEVKEKPTSGKSGDRTRAPREAARAAGRKPGADEGGEDH